MTASRRQFLAGAASAALGSTLVAPTASAAPQLPSPDSSGIDHIIVVMMENRSFDHFLGWLPGANGKQAGLTYVDSYGAARSASWSFDAEDLAPMDQLNEVLWHAVRGPAAPYPADAGAGADGA